jgi:hypothetical protein
VLAGPVDQDLSHGFGGDAEEVAATGIGSIADEPKVRLVHERGGIETVIGTFLGHLHRGQPAKLVVDERQQQLGRPGVAVLRVGKDTGYFAHRHGFRRQSG